MQILVHDNYSKFMRAADLSKLIHENLSKSQLDDDLENLKQSL